MSLIDDLAFHFVTASIVTLKSSRFRCALTQQVLRFEEARVEKGGVFEFLD